MVAPVQPGGENTLNIEHGEKAEGIYSNLVLVSHSPHEFVIDFAPMLPDVSKAKADTRILAPSWLPTQQNASISSGLIPRSLLRVLRPEIAGQSHPAACPELVEGLAAAWLIGVFGSVQRRG